MRTDKADLEDWYYEINDIHAEEETTGLLHGKYEHYIGKVYWERFVRTQEMSEDY